MDEDEDEDEGRFQIASRRIDNEPHWYSLEKGWFNLIDLFPEQISGTCSAIVINDVVHYRYTLAFHRQNIPLPFQRLCIQYLIDFGDENWGYGLAHEFHRFRCACYYSSPSTYYEIPGGGGLVDTQDYCLGGNRGEALWIPEAFGLDKNIPRRFPVVDEYKRRDSCSQDDFIRFIENNLWMDGPVYGEFWTYPGYCQRHDPIQHHLGEPHGASDVAGLTDKELQERGIYSHAVMIVGSGSLTMTRDDVVKPYFVYRTYGRKWGNQGFMRIWRDDVFSAWVPQVPQEIISIYKGSSRGQGDSGGGGSEGQGSRLGGSGLGGSGLGGSGLGGSGGTAAALMTRRSVAMQLPTLGLFRIRANRQSKERKIARSKEKKIRHISDLKRLQTEATFLGRLTILQRNTNGLPVENSELKLRLQTAEQQVHLQDGNIQSSYNSDNVAERDFLRTEGDPGAASYTIKEALALIRSMVPAQRSIPLHLHASVLDKAMDNIYQNEIGCTLRKDTPENLIDWKAVWAFELGPEPELALSLRMSLDDNNNSVVLACAKVIQCILCCDINEGFFVVCEKISACKKETYTVPIFRSRPKIDVGFLHDGFWKYNSKLSNILPFSEDIIDDDEPEGEHTIQDDVVIARQYIVPQHVQLQSGGAKGLFTLLSTDLL